ncbi:pilus assembly protein CpaF [Iodidimonas muriae]|uniref:Pilus assembly protein CpaF n=1 Tax=Iodidimonas muriae TaxID=261467 RepID=A0ABQ2LEA6_9PROT|nr:CpaF family protein [Iodidimonas muriae]GER06952.1 pilus assembly protein CpaF [Kordiimonadales bacterium JCM 17843]GGO13618.1 pilus assembly protein CpaF [Iodidimonas muriae]
MATNAPSAPEEQTAKDHETANRSPRIQQTQVPAKKPGLAPDKERVTELYNTDNLTKIKDEILPVVLDQIDGKALVGLTREELLEALEPIVLSTTAERKIMLNNKELGYLRRALLDEIVGFGPLEPLLADSKVNDILVNAPDQVYAEREGKLEISDVTFRDNEHILQIANKICNWVGRRVDMTTPMADARLPDGSRVNVIVPPLALRGPSISIRKFSKNRMELPDLVARGSLSEAMARFMQIATHARLNIVISGGTGSGKTTMLNALSQYIDPGERIVTIEDAAELQLRQPHVVPLETRPANLEGAGQVTISDLLVNALRMRPDRIILGEVRGKECFDMLQAFNTGHDGGMCTLHANRPREAISRMENLVAMGNPNFPTRAVRQQISETIDIVIQVKRMRDGKRRVTDIVEVIGMEGDVITTQSLYNFEYSENEQSNSVSGTYEYSGLPFRCAKRVREAGLGRNLEELLQ